MNETGDWIFSDEAHEWMDRKRRYHTYQNPDSHGEIRYGWEFGLFGLKNDSGATQFNFTACFAQGSPL